MNRKLHLSIFVAFICIIALIVLFKSNKDERNQKLLQQPLAGMLGLEKSENLEHLKDLTFRLRFLELLRRGDTNAAINSIETIMYGDVALFGANNSYSDLASLPKATNILRRLNQYIRKYPPKESGYPEYDDLLQNALDNLSDTSTNARQARE